MMDKNMLKISLLILFYRLPTEKEITSTAV